MISPPPPQLLASHIPRWREFPPIPSKIKSSAQYFLELFFIISEIFILHLEALIESNVKWNIDILFSKNATNWSATVKMFEVI